jgi:hypothetical protein
MGSTQTQPLRYALARAADCAGLSPFMSLTAVANDPLRLDLPPAYGPGGTPAPNSRDLRAMAALYFDAELDQAGVFVVAGSLVKERYALPVMDQATMKKLCRAAETRALVGPVFTRAIVLATVWYRSCGYKRSQR